MKQANCTLTKLLKGQSSGVFDRFDSVTVKFSLHTCYFGFFMPTDSPQSCSSELPHSLLVKWSVCSGTCEGESHGEASRTLNLCELSCTERCERRLKSKYANAVLLSVKHVNVSLSQDRQNAKRNEIVLAPLTHLCIVESESFA